MRAPAGRGRGKASVSAPPTFSSPLVGSPTPSFSSTSSTQIGQKDAAAFRKVTQEEALLLRPDMYIGSTKQTARKEFHLPTPSPSSPSPQACPGGVPLAQQAVLKSTTVSFAETHIVNELISNVADNVCNSRRAGIHPGECWMDVDRALIVIANQGIAMPIEKDLVSDLWVPEICFGTLHGGDNLGDTRGGGGMNGIGAGAMTLNSKLARVEILNPVSHLSYCQEWADNMRVKSEPEITDYTGQESLVRVSYILDHERFGYPSSSPSYSFSYSPSAIEMFRWRCASLSFTAGIPVTFNGERMEYNLLSYARLYMPNLDAYVVYNQPAVGTSPGIQMLLADTPRAGKQIGFCNHIVNSAGGAHVKAALDCVKHAVVTEQLKKSEVKITNTQIKSHVLVIISVTGVINPTFDNGQTKTSFNMPMPKFLLPEQSTAAIRTWKVASEMLTYTQDRAFKGVGKLTDADRRGHRINVGTGKGEDANLAGGPKSYLCSLHWCEGDSAEGYLKQAMEYMDGGMDLNGTLPFRGKFINVVKKSEAKVKKNPEFVEILRRLGIEVGMDMSLEKNRKLLRYGRVVFHTDADIDGTHIKALFILFFDHFFPHLLEQEGFVVDFMTPYMRGEHSRQGKVKFYYEAQYTEWLRHNSTDGWVFTYYKGLGNSELKEIIDDQRDKKEITFVYDKQAKAKIALAMAGSTKAETSARMDWIRGYRERDVPVDIPNDRLTISDFVDFQLRPYGVNDLDRHIPALMSGMTRAQTKIVCASFRTWGRMCGGRRKEVLKDFAGWASKLTQYHHGDISKTIICLAQTHIGSNNYPFLIGKGTFGTIDRGTKHAAAPRYLYILHPAAWLPYLYRPEDDCLLEWLYDGTIRIEPRTYYGVIPAALLNGTKCVAAGAASEIYACNVLEIIAQFREKLLHGTPFTPLRPWYRNYPGEVYLTEDGRLVSRGKACVLPNGNVEVTCLPIGVWNRKYKEDFLDKQLFSGGITGYITQSTANRTYFEIEGVQLKEGELLSDERVQTVRKREVNNLNLLGEDGFPVKYKDTAAIQQAFFDIRLPLYDKRKAHMISQAKADLSILQERRAYIQAYVDDRFDFRSPSGGIRDREDVLRDIRELGLNTAFYKDRKKPTEEGEEMEKGVAPKYTEVKPHEMDRKGIQKLDAKEAVLLNQIAFLEKVTREQMWLTDLDELEKKVIAVHGRDQRVYTL